jgi:hypothetical protein
MNKPHDGPWTYQEASDDYTHIVRAPDNVFIVQLAQDTSGRAEADARLIAAAPELLTACKSALSTYALPDCRARELLQDAIAKAEGRPLYGKTT